MNTGTNSTNTTIPFFNNPGTIGIEKIFSVIDKIYDCNKGWYSMIIELLKGCFKIVSYFGIYILLENYGKILKPCKLFILKFAYTRLSLNANVRLNANVVDKFKKMIPPPKKDEEQSNEVWYSGLPLYLEKEGNDNVIYYFSYTHLPIIDELLANDENEDIHNTICKDESGKTFTPLNMFASDNYIKIEKLCYRYFETHEATEMITPPLVFINSPAGYGKTKGIHYLAKSKLLLNIHKEVRLIDLTSPTMINKSFSSIIAGLTEKEVHVPTIIAFDELDKYISLYTRHIYTSSKKGIKKDEGTLSNMDEVVDDDYSTFEKHVKLSIIFNIGRLDSVKNYYKGVVWMFFANNIHSVFQGLDQTHIHSIKTRFTFIDFYKCGKDELSRYLTVFNDKIKNPEHKYEPLKLRGALRKLRNDISVTYREIQVCMNMANYDIGELVKHLNNGVYNPLLDYNGEEGEICNYGTGTSISNITSPDSIIENIVEKMEYSQQTVQKIREKKKEKEEIIFDMINLIKNTVTGEESTLSDEELIRTLEGMSNGYTFIKLVETEITRGADIFSIMIQCTKYRPNILEYLLKIGADPNLKCGNLTLLDYNLRSKLYNIESAIILMERGADIGNDFFHILGNCRVIYQEKLLDYLIEEKGFNVNAKYSIKNTQSLLNYSPETFVRDVSLLIKKGFSKENINILFEEYLQWPNISYDIIMFFLNEGCDVNMYIKKYNSPIFSVISKRNLTVEEKKLIISKMLEMGCNITLNYNSVCSRDSDYFKRMDKSMLDMIPDSMFG